MQALAEDQLFTDHGSVHPLLRVLAFGGACIFATTLLAMVAMVAALLLGAKVDMDSLRDPASIPTIVSWWVVLAAIAPIAVLFTRLLDCQPLSALGLSLKRGWGASLLAGALYGAGLMAAIFAVLIGAGAARTLPAPDPLRAVLLGLAAFVPAAAAEEILFRGYILRNLAQAFGPRPALLASSVLFGLGHVANNEFNALALLNIILAGVLLGYPYLATRRLWVSYGLHLAWNFAQGPLFGMPVSGFAAPGVLHTALGEPRWLTGGRFGPEASLTAGLVILAGIALLFWWYRDSLLDAAYRAAPAGPAKDAGYSPFTPAGSDAAGDALLFPEDAAPAESPQPPGDAGPEQQ